MSRRSRPRSLPTAPRVHPHPDSQPGLIALARVLRPRGRIGEVAAEILTDFPARLTALSEVLLDYGRGEPPRPARIRRCWLHQGRAIFHFEGVDSISAAEQLRGCEVLVPLSERVALPPGRYFVSDLTGCEVWEAGASAAPLGTVRDLAFETGTPLLIVDTPRGELLIPFAEAICTRIDVAARRIEVVLPEGLRELNT